MKSSRFLPVWAAACLQFATSSALAGGYATARFGGEHGHPATDHPTAIYYNPAGLALVNGTVVYIEGLFVQRSATYERPEAAIDDLGGGTPDDATARAANSGTAELSNFLVSPFLGVASDLGVERLGVGMAVYAPFGGQASWGTDDQFANDPMYPGAYDGAQRWHTIEGSQRVIYLTVAGAYRLPGNLSVGAGLSAVRQSLSVVRARTFDGTDDLVFDDGSIKEGRSLIEGDEFTYAFGAGLMWSPSDQLRIGLSYQSAPGMGQSELEGQLTTKLGAAELGVVDTVLYLKLPDSFRLGVVYDVSQRLQLRASGDITRWGTFDYHCLLRTGLDPSECDDEFLDTPATPDAPLVLIPRNWNNTFGVRVGGSYMVMSTLEVFGGTGFDSNAVPDETLEAGLMDMNKIVTSAGVRYAMSDSINILGSLTNVLYFSRETALRDPADVPARSSLRTPDGAGKYSQSINFLTVGAQYAF